MRVAVNKKPKRTLWFIHNVSEIYGRYADGVLSSDYDTLVFFKSYFKFKININERKKISQKRISGCFENKL